MAAPLEYTAEQLNYYRICYVVTDILTEGLRTIFKQEWDNRFKATLGEWKDDLKNGLDFLTGESPRKRSRNACLFTTMGNGDRAEWDCTMLFYAILYSDCIRGLNPTVQSNVDDLRKVRNEEFAHMPRGHLSNKDFQNVILKVSTEFHALGLPTIKIHDIQNQTSFPTKELKDVLKKVDDLQQEVQEKETKLQEKDKKLHEKSKELQEKEEQQQVLQEQLHADVSPFCILPPKPTHDISAHEPEVGEITQQLKALKGANDDGLSILYISGNPGSGKSQLARLAAKRFYDEVKEIPSALSFVMTLNADNLETLLESYVSFARHCKCPEYAVTNTLTFKDLSTEEKIASLKTLISAKIELYTSWLLVVDNVTSVSRVHVHLPDPGNEQWGRGQLLITTQDTTSIPLTSSSIQHISASKGMHPDDASSLLRRLSGVSDNEMEKEIVRVLDYQPLALASAATYVRQVRQSKVASNFGWVDYLKKLDKGQRSATESILAETNPSYQKSMTTAITLAMEKAMETDKVIHHVFTFLSLCAPQPILQDIVINYIMEVDEEFEDEDMIGTRISRCSLLLFKEEESGVYIRVHGVVHYVINSVAKDYAKDKYIEAVDGAVTLFSKFKDLDFQVIGAKIAPHLRTLIIKIETLFSEQRISQTLEMGLFPLQSHPHGFEILGKMCRNHYEFHAALKYFQVAQLGPGQVHVATSHNNLAMAYRDLGDLEQAKDYYARALDIDLKKLGPEHVNVATWYNNLGEVHSKLGDLEKAKDCCARALDIHLKKVGPEHVTLAPCYNNLGTVHRALADIEQASDCHARALDIRLKKLGPEHVHVATSYNNLGLVRSELGDLEQAKDCHERALDISLKKLGPEDINVATSCSNLGLVHRELGNLERAKDCHARALDIRLKKRGPEHIDVANSYHNLGIVRSLLGDLEQAKYCFVHALDINQKKLGPEHVHVATSYNNLGLVRSELGDLEQAKDCHARALDIRLKKLGPEHVDDATSCNNLGEVHRELGDLEQAKDYHARALDIRLKKLGPEQVNVLSSYNNLGEVHRELGDLEGAKDCHARALDIRLKKLGPEHVDVPTSCNNLALVHSELGDLEKAKDCCARAIEIFLIKLGPDHVNVAASYNILGDVHHKLGDLEQAKDCHARALDIHLKQLGPEHVNVASSYNSLGEEHRELGDLERAKDCQARALNIRLKKLGPEHVDVAASYYSLGNEHCELGDLEQAKDCLARALDINLKESDLSMLMSQLLTITWVMYTVSWVT